MRLWILPFLAMILGMIVLSFNTGFADYAEAPALTAIGSLLFYGGLGFGIWGILKMGLIK